MRNILSIFLLFFAANFAFAQEDNAEYFFFDSPDAEAYDTGLGFAEEGSSLTTTCLSGTEYCEKMPITADQKVVGNNAISVTYTSVEDGDWKAIIIQAGWRAINFDQKETVSFSLFAEEGVAKNLLPALYFEIEGSDDSQRVALGDYVDDLPAATWVEVNIAIDDLKNTAGNENVIWSNVKGFCLAQNTADGAEHTILVDNIRAIGDGNVVPPSAVFEKIFTQGTDIHAYDQSFILQADGSSFEEGCFLGEYCGKIPVAPTAFVGENALSLKWTSADGGNWEAGLAKADWSFTDVEGATELFFWAYSAEGIAKENLPGIKFESLSGWSDKFLLSAYNEDLPAGVWTKLVLRPDFEESGVDMTGIKMVGFCQDVADGAEHHMLVDDLTFSNLAEEVPAVTALTAEGFDSHVNVRWDGRFNNETTFEVLEEVNGGLRLISATESTFLVDFVGQDINRNYVVRQNLNGQYSPLASASAVTKELTDEQLLDMVQKAAFEYFWESPYAHGATPERRIAGVRENNTVAAGGSGWGFMALPIGVEHGWVTREEAAERALLMAQFFANAERFHGAWSHWINAVSGKAIPFSELDDGGDLVETALLMQGMLATANYFDGNNANEKGLRTLVYKMMNEIEWDFYRNGTDALYWHWSPNHDFEMNHKIAGFNEALMVYVLAASMTEHKIEADIYHDGWASGPAFENGNEFYGFNLPLGPAMGGPLFLSQYSFMVMDPFGMKDQYAAYDEQVVNQTKINHAFCVDNPNGHTGYSDLVWGLTASDNPDGYLAQEPGDATHDNGTITPTAALGAYAFTPELSLPTLKHFYREMGAEIWDLYGFRDAFHVGREWVADGYISIDQGPILAMIENHRSGLLWKLGMTSPYVQTGLRALDIDWNTEKYNVLTDNDQGKELQKVAVYVNSEAGYLKIFTSQNIIAESLKVIGVNGQSSALTSSEKYNQYYTVPFSGLTAGLYYLTFTTEEGELMTSKIIIQ